MAGKLFFVLFFAYLATVANSFNSDEVTETCGSMEGTELLGTFLVHRHGDRTPVKDLIGLVGAEYFAKIEEAVRPWGYGQLTNAGRRTAFELGKFIRRRYNDLLSPIYNTSDIYIRSTDSTRAKMTVLTAMAAVYPAIGDTWSQDVNWVPVPYTTVPARYDFNMAILNCPKFSDVYKRLMMRPNPFSEYSGVMTKLGQIFGNPLLPMIPGLAFPMYDLLVSELSLGIELDEEVMAIMPELKEAAGSAMNDVFGTDEYLPSQAGVLLQEFYTYAEKIISGEETQKVRVYSAHDVNVYSFAAVASITPRSAIGMPTYGSTCALEIRRVVETGENVVLPVYLPSPYESAQYLEVTNCGCPCSLESFISITSVYARNFTAWRDECGYTEDLEIDTQLID